MKDRKMCSKRPSPNLAGLYAFVGLRTRRILTLNLTRMGHWNQRTARASVRAGSAQGRVRASPEENGSPTRSIWATRPS